MRVYLTPTQSLVSLSLVLFQRTHWLPLCSSDYGHIQHILPQLRVLPPAYDQSQAPSPPWKETARPSERPPPCSPCRSLTRQSPLYYLLYSNVPLPGLHKVFLEGSRRPLLGDSDYGPIQHLISQLRVLQYALNHKLPLRLGKRLQCRQKDLCPVLLAVHLDKVLLQSGLFVGAYCSSHLCSALPATLLSLRPSVLALRLALSNTSDVQHLFTKLRVIKASQSNAKPPPCSRLTLPRQRPCGDNHSPVPPGYTSTPSSLSIKQGSTTSFR